MFGCSATEFAGFYRKPAGDPTGNSGISTGSLCNSTGCVVSGSLVMVKGWNGFGWIGEVEMELVMTQGQRNRRENECTKLVGG